MKTKKAVAYGSCVNRSAEFVNAVKDRARDITYKTLIKYVAVETLKEYFSVYDWGQKDGLQIWDDYAVSFYKSQGSMYGTFYIVKHSGIEYFWKL